MRTSKMVIQEIQDKQFTGSFDNTEIARLTEDVKHKTSSVTYYELLGIPRDADAVSIKKSYRTMSLRFHPDKTGETLGGTKTEIFKMLQNAYATLIDPAEKHKYDTQDRSRGTFTHDFTEMPKFPKDIDDVDQQIDALSEPLRSEFRTCEYCVVSLIWNTRFAVHPITFSQLVALEPGLRSLIIRPPGQGGWNHVAEDLACIANLSLADITKLKSAERELLFKSSRALAILLRDTNLTMQDLIRISGQDRELFDQLLHHLTVENVVWLLNHGGATLDILRALTPEIRGALIKAAGYGVDYELKLMTPGATIEKNIIYLSNINGKIAYTMQPYSGRISQNILTDVSAPEPFTLASLQPLRTQILANTVKHSEMNWFGLSESTIQLADLLNIEDVALRDSIISNLTEVIYLVDVLHVPFREIEQIDLRLLTEVFKKPSDVEKLIEAGVSLTTIAAYEPEVRQKMYLQSSWYKEWIEKTGVSFSEIAALLRIPLESISNSVLNRSVIPFEIDR